MFTEGIKLPEHAQHRPLNAIISQEPAHPAWVCGEASPIGVQVVVHLDQQVIPVHPYVEVRNRRPDNRDASLL